MAYRKTRCRFFAVAMLACFLCCFKLGWGQHITTTVDKQQIVIGEQVLYKVRATFEPGVFNVHWFALPDSLAHFDLVGKSKVDSSSENNNTVLQQTIILTSFDSGKWNIPAFAINFNPVKGDTSINLFTDSIAIAVGYSPADSTGQLRDIKPVMDVFITDYFWYTLAGIVLLAFITGTLLYGYFKKRKKKPRALFTSTLSPYEEAMSELALLEKYDLSAPGYIKQYHTRLSTIFKRYYSRKQGRDLMNKTTGEILTVLKEGNVETILISPVAEALRCADAVKFAKYIPVPAESERCRTLIQQSIISLETHKQT